MREVREVEENERVENKTERSENIEKLSYGSITIADNVILDIATVALSKIKDISVEEEKGMKKLRKNLSIEREEGEESDKVKVNLKISVKYGRSIIDIAKDIQKRLKEEIENLTGLKVVEVNVRIEDLIFEEPKNVDNIERELERNLEELDEESKEETEGEDEEE